MTNLADLGEKEQRLMRAFHEFSCDEQPEHRIEDHDPLDEYDPTGFPQLEAALEKHGLELVMSDR